MIVQTQIAYKKAIQMQKIINKDEDTATEDRIIKKNEAMNQINKTMDIVIGLYKSYIRMTNL